MSEVTLNRTLTIPKLTLVVLIGPSGSGKSTFARSYFKPTEIRRTTAAALVSDDENAQDATGDAFDVLHYIAAKRLTRGAAIVLLGAATRIWRGLKD